MTAFTFGPGAGNPGDVSRRDALRVEPAFFDATNPPTAFGEPIKFVDGRAAKIAGVNGATKAFLRGAPLTLGEQALANFTSITDGSMTITNNSVVGSATSIDLSTATSLADVASLIDTALELDSDYVSALTWDASNSRFEFSTDGTGSTKTLGYASGPAGTDLATLLKLTLATEAVLTSPGEDASDDTGLVAGILGRSIPQQGAATDIAFGAGTPDTTQVQDIIRQGYVLVTCALGTPARGGTVYMQSEPDTGRTVGEFHANSSAKTVALTGFEWAATGKEASNIAEIFIG